MGGCNSKILLERGHITGTMSCAAWKEGECGPKAEVEKVKIVTATSAAQSASTPFPTFNPNTDLEFYYFQPSSTNSGPEVSVPCVFNTQSASVAVLEHTSSSTGTGTSSGGTGLDSEKLKLKSMEFPVFGESQCVTRQGEGDATKAYLHTRFSKSYLRANPWLTSGSTNTTNTTSGGKKNSTWGMSSNSPSLEAENLNFFSFSLEAELHYKCPKPPTQGGEQRERIPSLAELMLIVYVLMILGCAIRTGIVVYQCYRHKKAQKKSQKNPVAVVTHENSTATVPQEDWEEDMDREEEGEGMLFSIGSQSLQGGGRNDPHTSALTTVPVPVHEGETASLVQPPRAGKIYRHSNIRIPRGEGLEGAEDSDEEAEMVRVRVAPPQQQQDRVCVSHVGWF